MLTWSRSRNVFRRDLNNDINAELPSRFEEVEAAGANLSWIFSVIGRRQFQGALRPWIPCKHSGRNDHEPNFTWRIL